MVVERRGADDGVRDALEALRQQIDRRVRAEQLCDQLTRLPNEAALLAAIDGLMERSEHFWLAFFEIDRFKWINDRFGYQSADALLQRVAAALEGAQDYFPDTVTAFRPHGDEFYMLGAWAAETDAAALHRTLDLVRQNVSALRVGTDRGTVECTVSVGWVDTSSLATDLATRAVVLTRREILSALEIAMAEAKWQKDCVVRFSSHLQTDTTLTLRSECSTCRCKFQVNVKRSALAGADKWCCPSCGTKQERPPIPDLDPVPRPETI
jgi:diguanylate cyclase (GGDEF)-like protein